MPRPMSVPSKSKDFKGSMKKLFKSLNKWKYVLVIALVLAMISAILSLVAPNKLSNLTDIITEGITPKVNETTINDIINDPSISMDDKNQLLTMISQNGITTKDEFVKMIDALPISIYNKIKPTIDMDGVYSIALLLAILYLVSALLNYIQSYLMASISNNYAKGLRSKISKKINVLPLKYFDHHETGDILSRITNDVDSIAMNMNHSLGSLVSNITLLLGSIFMMFITNYIMAIVAIVSSLIGFGFMGFILSKSQKYFIRKQQELGDLNGHIEEIYSGHNVVKSYNGEVIASKEFNNLNMKLFNSNRMSQFLSGLMGPMMGFIGNLSYVATCVVGALLVINGDIKFGVIVAFMIYVRMFTNPLNQLAQATTSLQSIAASSERVFEFLDEEELEDESKLTAKLDPSKVKGKIEFKNVKFGYDDGKTIIKDFNVLVKPGQKIAIVGPTGAGKTTMVNLLMKFYNIKDGEILIDGVSTKELTRENIHDLFIMVLQDTWLFNGSIRDNIKFNNHVVNDEQIWAALEVVGVDYFVKSLPKMLDYEINDSESISAGQRQLLTIARGMIKNAPFLILDEATSNVDTRTEELVQKAMDKLAEGRTSFIIAHRLSTIKNADLILVMRDGNIIEQGNHNELLKLNGFYAELYNSQFKK